MRMNRFVAIALLIVSFLAITVASEISKVTDSIEVEEQQTYITNFYDETRDIYGDCTYYNNYTLCLNTSGQNTDCSLQQSQYSFKCKTGSATIKKNATDCKPLNKYIVSINKGAFAESKEIDFSEWGACIHDEEDGCLTVTCVSHDDGAFKGQFTGCNGGKSCQKFEICDNSLRVFYKNSREDFAENDPTFYLEKLAIKEVGK